MKFGMLFVLTIPISVQVVQSLIRYPRISAADRDHSAPPRDDRYADPTRRLASS